MSSLMFPDTGTRMVILDSGEAATHARGYLYADAALTIPAEVYTDVSGSVGEPIAEDGAGRVSVRLDAYGRLPNFWGPEDGTDRLWVVVNGVSSVVDADYNSRLDTLSERVADLEAGGASDALVVHKAGGESVTGVKTFTVSPVVPTPTADTEAANKGYADDAASDAQAYAVQRVHHTGPQAISTVTGLQTALDGKTPRLVVVVDAAGGADYTTLASALTAAGSTQTDLVLTSALTLAGNTTVPANVHLRVQRAGSVGLGGFTLTINGRLDADRGQIFTGSGTVTLAATSVEAALPEWWGAVPAAIGSTPSVDSGPGITSAVYAVKAAGGTVDCTAGNYKIATAVDASSIQSNQSFHVTPKTVTIRGRGSRETYWTGGESGFGFLDMVGSNYIRVEGITMQSTGTVQYGILTGRPSGNGSSGLHRFTDVHIYGPYTVAAFFGTASEVCNYDAVSIYTLAGKPMVLAKDIGTWPVTAKYTALSSTTPYGGGNGVNRMTDCQLLTSSADPADCALFLEFTQTFLAENLYLFTHNATSQIIMQRRSHDATFINVHQEFLNTEPWGIFYSATEDSGVTPQFTNQSFIGCRMYGIYGDDGTKLSNLLFRGSFRGTGAKTYIVDVDTGVDMDLHSADTSICPDIAGISQANLKYRVRTAGGFNSFGSCLAANITVPAASAEMIGSRSSVETYTNKRISPRVTQQADVTSIVVNFDSLDCHATTALAHDLFIGVGGTPTSMQPFTLRLLDNGVSRALTWEAHFRGIGVSLPSATTPGKTMYVSGRYNTAAAKADVFMVAVES